MIEACERRILEFPLDMDARDSRQGAKREGWYAWASEVLLSGSNACGQKREAEQMRIADSIDYSHRGLGV